MGHLKGQHPAAQVLCLAFNNDVMKTELVVKVTQVAASSFIHIIIILQIVVTEKVRD